MMNLLTRLVGGSKNDRLLKKIQPLVDEINALEPQISALSDEALKAKTAEFRELLKSGKTLDDILPQAFAVGLHKYIVSLNPIFKY